MSAIINNLSQNIFQKGPFSNFDEFKITLKLQNLTSATCLYYVKINFFP